jgi:hypothetical protein
MEYKEKKEIDPQKGLWSFGDWVTLASLA